ncbi:LAME_0B02432g1_1 [Lachancea meyersii CBS 8951]|uniref:Nucleolar protein 12 n=1 Tax=Lachancea meyersii CBS 8951 TaxID=1266667 RepID=A0A1G4ITJ8_9SACH|nr:LAME_0B02432g1_1 [Lachancea meyersii CBS 8951]
MASIDKLFGSAGGQKLVSGLSKLFGGSSGPLDALKVKQKSRTVLPEAKRKTDASTAEKSSENESQNQPESDTTGKRPLEGVTEVEVEEDSKKKKVSKRQKRKLTKDAENTDLESKYYSNLLLKEEKSEQKEEADDADDVSKEETADVAETAVDLKPEAKVASKKDFKEAELEKAERTVFVGNAPKDLVTSKTLNKKFKKLFAVAKETKNEGDSNSDSEEQGSDENAVFKIESIRFRSISFEEALPRKVAFVQQKLHKSRDSVNAYVVYADRAAVKVACKSLNGQLFEGHHLRVDSVAHPTQHDNKRSVFVGNLDFEETEENLWKQFEKTGDIEYVRVVRDPKTNLGKGFAYVQFADFQTVSKALLLDGKKLNGTGRKLRVTRCKNMKKAQPTSQNGRSKELTDQQRTKLGRAKKVLGKADRSTAGKEITIEGLRATKGATTPILKKKKQRSKTGRVTKRSTAFKKANQPK